MTVPGQLQREYNKVWPTLKSLKERCDLLLKGAANSVGGRYYSRIKEIESILSRIEKDGQREPFREIEDLFAATVVVPNITLFEQVESEISKSFSMLDKSLPKTGKPQEFLYDDYRLLLQIKQEPGRVEPELSGLIFELQIKTDMQNAASIVARTLEYKPPRLSWIRVRLASRIRALVEMVDDLLERLAGPEEVREPDYDVFQNRNKIIDVLARMLPPQQLPEDKRRLSVTVEQYLNLCKPAVSVDDFERMLAKDEYTRIREAASLTAAGSAFIVLFMEERLAKSKEDPASLRGNRRFLITSEMIDLCPILAKVPKQRRVLLDL